jgi:hypothetical protein
MIGVGNGRLLMEVLGEIVWLVELGDHRQTMLNGRCAGSNTKFHSVMTWIAWIKHSWVGCGGYFYEISFQSRPHFVLRAAGGTGNRDLPVWNVEFDT